jgi:hypothetical protein
MPGPFDQTFKVDSAVSEGGLGLPSRGHDGEGQFLQRVNRSHALTAATHRGLDQQGKANLLGDGPGFLFVFYLVVGARQNGNANLRGHASRGGFVPHEFHRFRTGTDEGQAGVLASSGETGVLGQKAVSRVDGVYLSLPGYGDDLVDAEVALSRRWGTDVVGLIRIADMQGRSISVRVDGYRVEARSRGGPLRRINSACDDSIADKCGQQLRRSETKRGERYQPPTGAGDSA